MTGLLAERCMNVMRRVGHKEAFALKYVQVHLAVKHFDPEHLAWVHLGERKDRGLGDFEKMWRITKEYWEERYRKDKLKNILFCPDCQHYPR